MKFLFGVKFKFVPLLMYLEFEIYPNKVWPFLLSFLVRVLVICFIDSILAFELKKRVVIGIRWVSFMFSEKMHTVNYSAECISHQNNMINNTGV